MFSHVEVVLFFTRPMNHDERYLDLASKNSFRHVRSMFFDFLYNLYLVDRGSKIVWEDRFW